VTRAGKGTLSEKIIYAVFLVSLLGYTHAFLAVIKTQATHDWTVKTSLEKRR